MQTFTFTWMPVNVFLLKVQTFFVPPQKNFFFNWNRWHSRRYRVVLSGTSFAWYVGERPGCLRSFRGITSVNSPLIIFSFQWLHKTSAWHFSIVRRLSPRRHEKSKENRVLLGVRHERSRASVDLSFLVQRSPLREQNWSDRNGQLNKEVCMTIVSAAQVSQPPSYLTDFLAFCSKRQVETTSVLCVSGNKDYADIPSRSSALFDVNCEDR